MLVGIVLMMFMFKQIGSGTINPEYFVRLENTALYWDLVHLVWVFLFPIFYLL